MPKTILITGAARGIGRAIAEKFAQHGYNIIINYNESRGLALAYETELKERGINALAIHADVSDPVQVKEMLRIANEKFRQIDVLVNNAGIAEMRLLTDIEESMWDRMFAVNVKGMFLCTQAVAPQMISAKSGVILNISSVWGLVGAAMETHYSATKGAVLAFTKALAKELGPSGIRVNAIAPGAVMTDMLAPLSSDILDMVADETPLGVIGTAEQIADAAYYLASDSGCYVTGQVLSVNGGYVIS